MSLVVIGDCHGLWNELNKIIQPGYSYLQTGDLGVGFPGHYYPSKFPSNFYFLRGNHDNPEVCKKHPNYLGDYGYLEKQKLFYISGAYSVDWKTRTIGIDWWQDEELSVFQLEKVIELFEKTKPEIVVSHDGPHLISMQLFHMSWKNKFKTKTCQALQSMLDKWKPEWWIFGHHHPESITQKDIDGTRFVCLPKLALYEIEELDW
jgi:Icc-related predicted phosphoesterase